MKAPSPRRIFLPGLLAVAFLLPGRSLLHAEPASPAVALQILQDLEKIETDRDAIMQKGWRAAAAAVSAAAQSRESAIDLYEEAVRQTQFAGADRESGQWREWKDRDGALLRSGPAGKALLFQLRYMKLTMRRNMGEEVSALLSDVIAYVAALQNEQGSIIVDKGLKDAVERAQRIKDQKRVQQLRSEMNERQFAENLLKGSVGGSVIAKYLGIDGEMDKAEKWPKEPGNLNAILDEIILPELRENRDPRLFAFWDDKLKRVGEKALEGGTDFGRSRYETIEFPKLVWERAQDYALFGEQSRALKDMLDAIRANPAHPQAEEWIGQLRKRLTAVTAPAPGGSEPAPSPAAEPAPPVP